MNQFQLDPKPFESFLDASAEVFSAPIDQSGPLGAFGIDEAKAVSDLAMDMPAGDAAGLGDYWYPKAPGGVTGWFVGKDKSKGIIRNIRQAVRKGLLGASETISDGMAYQFMMFQEQGELHVRYATLYGIVRQMPGQSCLEEGA